MRAQDDLERRLIREIAARKEAERLLEVKSLELVRKNQDLQSSSRDLLDHVELISTIIDAVPHIVLTCNERSIIEMANSASAKMLGYPPERMVGQHIGMVLPSHGDYRRALDMESFLIPDLAVRKSDGTFIPGELRGRRTRVKDKPFAVMVISDTSARKAAETMTERVHKQLYESRRLEAIGTLSSGIAHELNTPIQFIGDNIKFVGLSLNKIHESYKLYDELKRKCQAAGLLPETVERVETFNAAIDLPILVDEIMASIRETMDGVRQVRDIALLMKEFNHPGTGAPEPSDINRLVQSAITICRSRHKDVVAVETVFATDLPRATCRPAQIQQVLVNMIVNAVEAIEEQGVATGVIRIQTKAAGDAVRIEISDNGPGIPNGLGEKIFDPFFTTKRVGKGTGQGLALAKDFIVNQHGGKLLRESRPGFATTFIIELPLKPPVSLLTRPPVRYAQA
jgi:two-component system NtrC family sensor kinase